MLGMARDRGYCQLNRLSPIFPQYMPQIMKVDNVADEIV
jgi:hypothetical protein